MAKLSNIAEVLPPNPNDPSPVARLGAMKSPETMTVVSWKIDARALFHCVFCGHKERVRWPFLTGPLMYDKLEGVTTRRCPNPGCVLLEAVARYQSVSCQRDWNWLDSQNERAWLQRLDECSGKNEPEHAKWIFLQIYAEVLDLDAGEPTPPPPLEVSRARLVSLIAQMHDKAVGEN